jgi:hypothetical protein
VRGGHRREDIEVQLTDEHIGYRVGPARVEGILVMPKELPEAILHIELEDAEVTYISAKHILRSLHNRHRAIALATRESGSIFSGAVCVHDLHRRAQLVPVVALPHV